jgi:carotenoid 1,2-hydratase
MTERGERALRQDASSLTLGPSHLRWDGEGLLIAFDEITAPLPRRLKGSLRLYPEALGAQAFALDPAARHTWRPIAPRAQVEVRLEHPALAWRGEAYFDTNWGTQPLEDAFRFWTWSRGHVGDDALIFYDVERRGGETAGLALRVGPHGEMTAVDAPPLTPLGPTFWGVSRPARADCDAPPRRVRTLEDAPFYTRSAFEAGQGGAPARIVHESLDLDRLRAPVVRAMLPFRMPRKTW